MSKGPWIAAVAIALAGAGWMYSRSSASVPSTAVPLTAPEALPQAADPSAAPTPVSPPSAAASASAASAKPPPGPFGNDSAADLLRKVQLAFGSGSAQEAQDAANVLQFCSQAAKAAEAMQVARDIISLVPESIRKFLDSFGGITNEQVDRAQSDARRCQVFDDATLARRGELFQKAHEGGAPGAAMSYLTWLTHDGKAEADPAVVDKLQAEVRQLAQAGDLGALTSYAFMVDSQAYGTSRTEREAYKEAWLRIVGEGNPGSAASNRELIAKLERFSKLPSLTPEQQREAEALAQQVYDAYHRRLNKKE